MAVTGLKVAVSIGGPASGSQRDWPEVVRFAVESERLGADFSRPLARLAEYCDILDLAFAGQPVAQRAAKKIPVYLATLGPRGLWLTGARADGWLGSCLSPRPAPPIPNRSADWFARTQLLQPRLPASRLSRGGGDPAALA